MALKVVWTDEARNELEEIIQNLERLWTEKELRKFFIRLEDCLNRIAEAPHRQKNSHRKPGTKEFQHSPKTTIFYTYDDQVVNILKVWINVRDPENL